MSTVLRWSFATLAIAGLMTAAPAMAAKEATTYPGELIVEDSAGLFSSDARKQAKEEFAKLRSTHVRQVTILTMTTLPPDEAAEYAKIVEKKDKDALGKFWNAFAKKEAKGERAKGVFILVCRKPGYVEVIADKPMRDQGFNHAKEVNVREKLLKAFQEAKDKEPSEQTAIRDKGLMAAVTELHYDVPVTTSSGSPSNHVAKDNPKGTNWTQWICIGVCVLLGLWLVIGLIRAFSGGGGGGYGGGYGGGGGGGFFSGLLGGMFGAMAGMWLYNNMFGGGMSSAYGDSGSTGDMGNSTESGTGDFSGDDGAGGGFDDGGSGGGDWGGGDTGGGGDWGGGGGGDWGGGGGDFGGGGGDF